MVVISGLSVIYVVSYKLKEELVRFSVMQWNIWTEKVENIAQTIRSVHPDVVCLQEVSTNTLSNPGINVAEWVAQWLGYYCYYAAGDSPIKEGRVEFHGNAILSLFPLHDMFSLNLKHANDPSNPWDKSPRGYMETNIVLSGGNLTIATAHASFCDKFTNDEIKKPEIDRLMEAISRHRERFIFAADLNALPNSYSVGRVKERLRDCGPSSSEATWTTKAQIFPDWAADGLKWRIDYVFCTSDLQVLDSRVVHTPYSDHLPILCTFEV